MKRKKQRNTEKDTVIVSSRTTYIWEEAARYSETFAELDRGEKLLAIGEHGDWTHVRGHGRKKWRHTSDYHHRSLAETAVYRFRQLMGRFMKARKWENERTEVRLKAKALNKMTRLGMPETRKTAV